MSAANLRECTLKMGYAVGYHERNRIYQRYLRIRLPDVHYTRGASLSPAGHHWRPCGLHGPGILLVDWDRGISHSVHQETIRKCLALGWKWIPDKPHERSRNRTT